MPIDILKIRDGRGGGEVDAVRESEVKRGRDCKDLDDAIEADQAWRTKIFDMEQLKKSLNALSKEISEKKKTDKTCDCSELVQKTAEIKVQIPEAEKAALDLEAKRAHHLSRIGNFVHSSVPVSNDEANNLVLRTWGTIDRTKIIDGTPGKMHHHEILTKLMGFDSKRGTELAGHRGYFLRGVGVLLNMALVQYGISFLRKRGYIPMQPPYFMRKQVMAQTAELKDFEETLYRIPSKDERDDLFLIATSEQPISAYHRGEFLEEKTLPYRYAGISTCFRKEAGSSGKDVWGLFRIHQFEKVEQFTITTPEDSWKEHENMIAISEEFYQSLGLPYRVVSIVSGALNDAASRKYDLEAWFPGYNDYREMVSCSNCTDYQARALEVRLGHPKLGDREKRYVHMLNGTLVATERCLCCILENFQTERGVVVPPALLPYMDGLEFLEYPGVNDNSIE